MFSSQRIDRGYYDWLDRPVSMTQRTNQRLLTKIRCFDQSSRQTYGSPRIHQDLLATGERVSVNRVARLMKSAGIQSKMAKRFVITTNSKNTLSPAPDRLKRNFFYRGTKSKMGVGYNVHPNAPGLVIPRNDTRFIFTPNYWLGHE